jgi:hypothetical protein
LTKPRLILIKAETPMMATMAQSTQVKATLHPTNEKGPAF